MIAVKYPFSSFTPSVDASRPLKASAPIRISGYLSIDIWLSIRARFLIDALRSNSDSRNSADILASTQNLLTSSAKEHKLLE